MSDSDILQPAMVKAGSIEAVHAKPRRSLDPRDIELLSAISKRLMSDPVAKALPDVMSFAFWCRRGNLRKLFEARADLGYNIGRGLAFHIAPSNVPVNFAFSWAFALLAGNGNVVRVPSKPFPQVGVICSAADDVMRELGDTRNVFVNYPSAGTTTEALSAISDVRVIWGGDATVASIRKMPSKPRCVDVPFADRYSIGCIDAEVVAVLDESGLESLVQGFYNDTYLMDQNACSSPMTVVWLNSSQEGKDRFWAAVRRLAVKEYVLQGAVATDKYVQLCRDAIDGKAVSCTEFDGYLDVLPIDLEDVANEGLGCFRGHGGYFYEMDAVSVDSVLPLVGQQCQTVTYFGTDPNLIRESVLDAGLTGIDRIVPVGKAMDIDIQWDGMDLLSTMSRKVDVR